MHECEQCHTPFEGRADARFCSDRCRSRNTHARRVAALDLLRRRTSVLIAGGDPSLLAALDREALQLFR